MTTQFPKLNALSDVIVQITSFDLNKLCDNVLVVLSGNNINFVHETKYLGVIINSSMKTSSDVVRQTRKCYAQTNMSLRNFRYCTNDVKCTLFKSFCANMPSLV